MHGIHTITSSANIPKQHLRAKQNVKVNMKRRRINNGVIMLLFSLCWQRSNQSLIFASCLFNNYFYLLLRRLLYYVCEAIRDSSECLSFWRKRGVRNKLPISFSSCPCWKIRLLSSCAPTHLAIIFGVHMYKPWQCSWLKNKIIFEIVKNQETCALFGVKTQSLHTKSNFLMKCEMERENQ